MYVTVVVIELSRRKHFGNGRCVFPVIKSAGRQKEREREMYYVPAICLYRFTKNPQRQNKILYRYSYYSKFSLNGREDGKLKYFQTTISCTIIHVRFTRVMI